MIPISEPHFPARRFVSSELKALPVVGPLIGSNQPPVHKQLYNILEKQFPNPLDMWYGKLVGGWLEFTPTLNQYHLSPVGSDGSTWMELNPQEFNRLKQALNGWARENGERPIDYGKSNI